MDSKTNDFLLLQDSEFDFLNELLPEVENTGNIRARITEVRDDIRNVRKEKRKTALSSLLGVTEAAATNVLVSVYKTIFKDTKFMLDSNGNSYSDASLTRVLSRALFEEDFPNRFFLFDLCICQKAGKKRAEELFKEFEMDYVRFSDWREILFLWAIEMGYSFKQYLELGQKVISNVPSIRNGLLEWGAIKRVQLPTKTVEISFYDGWPNKDDGGEYIINKISFYSDWFHTVSLTRRDVLFNNVLFDIELPYDVEKAFIVHSTVTDENWTETDIERHPNKNSDLKTEWKSLGDFAVAFDTSRRRAVNDRTVYSVISELIDMKERTLKVSRRTLIAAMRAKGGYTINDINDCLEETGFPKLDIGIGFDRVIIADGLTV